MEESSSVMEKKKKKDDGDGVDPHSYRLLLSCPTGLSRAQVLVDFSASYDRAQHPNVELEDSISQIWDQRVEENPSLYNGKKFRYGGHAIGFENHDSKTESNVCLHLGLTDYRTFVGTNLNPLWEQFLLPSEDECLQCQHTSSPLGNGAIVETIDKNILLLQRSHNVGEFPGYFVFPGGHPEPHEIGIDGHVQDRINIKDLNKKVSEEMFDGIIREVVEETGIPASSLADPTFIGISRRELNVRPTAFFFISCNLHSEDVISLYQAAQDGYESTQLFIVSKNELEKMALRMPGCHQGGFALYNLMSKTMEK